MSNKLEEITTLTGHTGQCWGVCFHPTQPLIASCSSDKSIRLYSFTKALSKNTFQHLNTLPSAHNRTIRQVAFSPDGRRMASASFDSTVGIWERTSSAAENDQPGFGQADSDEEDASLEEWENVGSLEGHESEVKSVAWSYDGSLLATCGRDKSVWIWDANTPDEDFECLAVLMDHAGDVKHVTFSPKEEILASSSYDDTVKLYAADYTTDEWAVTHSLPPTPPKHYDFPNAPEPEADESGTGHSSTVWASAFSPCGSYIASCSDDLSIKIWARFKRKDVKGEPGGAFRIGRTEKEGWYCALTIKDAHERSIYSIDWTEAGSWQPQLEEGAIALGRIASVGGDGKINVYGITATPDENQRCDFLIKYDLLAAVESAHGVYDINHVQWCRLGKPVPTLGQSKTQAPRHQPTLSSTSDNDTDMEDTANAGQLQSRVWSDARNVLATAADDGSVKVWTFA